MPGPGAPAGVAPGVGSSCSGRLGDRERAGLVTWVDNLSGSRRFFHTGDAAELIREVGQAAAADAMVAPMVRATAVRGEGDGSTGSVESEVLYLTRGGGMSAESFLQKIGRSPAEAWRRLAQWAEYEYTGLNTFGPVGDVTEIQVEVHRKGSGPAPPRLGSPV